jgi:hypothetical protein
LLWCEIFIELRKKVTLSLICYVTAHVLLILLETNTIWSYFSSKQVNHNSLVVYRDSLRYINKTDSGFTNALCHRFFANVHFLKTCTLSVHLAGAKEELPSAPCSALVCGCFLQILYWLGGS